MEEQVASFMTGLQPKSPKKVVELWILGVINRSGAVQYAVLSPSLKRFTKIQFENTKWVTWQSSPWVNNVHFVNKYKISNKKIQYVIAYDLLTSFGTSYKVITVKINPEPYRTNWFISKIQTKNNKYEAFTPAETIIK